MNPVRIASPADLGRLIRERRKALRLSQSMLAGITGVAQPNLSKIERGESASTLDTYLRLSNALGIDLFGMVRS